MLSFVPDQIVEDLQIIHHGKEFAYTKKDIHNHKK